MGVYIDAPIPSDWERTVGRVRRGTGGSRPLVLRFSSSQNDPPCRKHTFFRPGLSVGVRRHGFETSDVVCTNTVGSRGLYCQWSLGGPQTAGSPVPPRRSQVRGSRRG